MKIDELKSQLKEEGMELIRNGIMENKNPNKLREELKTKLNENITYYLIKQFILQEFKKEWIDKSWKDVLEQKSSSEGDSLIANSESTTHNDSSLTSTTNEVKFDISSENNNLQTILKVLYHLENQNKQIIKMIKTLSQSIEYLNKNYKENFDDFVKIYSSEYVKTTLNINKKIKEELQKYIGNPRGVKNNESKLINTALLIALFNEKNNNKIKKGDG